jgi:uncharacterized protein (DUF427 family)
VWCYEAPYDEVPFIGGYLAFYWDRVDAWYEEDEPIFGHPRDPFHRVDVRASRRLVRVVLAGEIVAESRRALFVFETGLPTRYYLPREDVRTELLEPTATRTVCPYRGTASYWTARVRGQEFPDVVWSYADPLPEMERLRDHLAFYEEKMESLTVDRAGEGLVVKR